MRAVIVQHGSCDGFNAPCNEDSNMVTAETMVALSVLAVEIAKIIVLTQFSC